MIEGPVKIALSLRTKIKYPSSGFLCNIVTLLKMHSSSLQKHEVEFYYSILMFSYSLCCC